MAEKHSGHNSLVRNPCSNNLSVASAAAYWLRVQPYNLTVQHLSNLPAVKKAQCKVLNDRTAQVHNCYGAHGCVGEM